MNTKQTYGNLHRVVLTTGGISCSDVPLPCSVKTGAGWNVKYLEFHPLSISNDECRGKSSSAPSRFLSRYRRACHSESRFIGTKNLSGEDF